MRRILLVLAFSCLAFGQRRGVTAEDYFSFENAGDAQISPDGRMVAYTVTTVDQKANRRMSRIWVMPIGGGAAVAETLDTASSNAPRWSPDGKYLAFVSARDRERPQIWLLSMSGGEARRL